MVGFIIKKLICIDFNMKIVIIHDNTPKLTIALLASLYKNNITENIIVFENSDKEPLNALSLFDYETIDNTKGKIIDFDKEIDKLNKFNHISSSKINAEMNCVKYGSVKHALTVQWLIEHLNDEFILLDSDILIKKDFRHLIDNTKLFVGQCTKYRVLPFLLYINAPILNEMKIKFFDSVNIHPFKMGYEYDTGGSFYKECKNKEFININLNDYFVHYGSGSWRKNVKSSDGFQGDYKNYTELQFLCENRNLFM